MKKVHSKDSTAIAFDQLGQGSAIILVGGAFTDRSQPTLVQLAALLAPHFTVFNYDRRGRGESGDTAPYAVEREVEDLGALITEAGGSAFVVGGSSGAVLALEAARKLPITKLALYEPPFIVDDSRPPLPADYVAQLIELISSGRRGDAVEFFMTKAVGVPAEFVAQMQNAPMWPALEAAATRWSTTAPSWETPCQAARCRSSSGPPSRYPRSSGTAGRALRGRATRYKRSRTPSPMRRAAPWKVRPTS